jgi:hypothetical protein
VVENLPSKCEALKIKMVIEYAGCLLLWISAATWSLLITDLDLFSSNGTRVNVCLALSPPLKLSLAKTLTLLALLVPLGLILDQSG